MCCSVLVEVSMCLSNAQPACASIMPQHVRQAFHALISIVDFMCVEEFESQYIVCISAFISWPTFALLSLPLYLECYNCP